MHPFAVLARWLPIAIVATLVCLGVYAAVQQSIRYAANDPQIQLAEDAAAALAAGQPMSAVVPAAKVDLARGLAPYLIVFDDAGRPVASSALLDGVVPTPPPGVLDEARRSGQDRVTWQPRPGVRGAAVVVRYGGPSPGFVLAGRSLREVEVREDQLLLMVGLLWLAALAGSLVAVAIGSFATARWLRVAPYSAA